MFGVSYTTVKKWRNPRGARERDRRAKARRRAASEALRLQEQLKRRLDAAKRASGAIGESYSLIRRAGQQLDAAVSEAKTDDARRALNAALRRMHQAEEEVVRALGVE
jgi:hypothetical protein